MGIIDRDYYGEHWRKNVLGIEDPKPAPPMPPELPPRRRGSGLPAWPFWALLGCVAAGVGFSYLVLLLRAL